MSAVVARCWPVQRRALLLSLAVTGALGTMALPASADTNSSVTMVIPVVPQIKSVTVSPASIVFGSCGPNAWTLSSGTGLPFPNGVCIGPYVTVTSSGTIPETILVQGSPAIPADGGTPWLPAGSTTTPGQDLYALWLTGTEALALTGAPRADLNTGTPAGGPVQPGTSASESPQIFGPSASTDQSTSFSSTVTWIAA